MMSNSGFQDNPMNSAFNNFRAGTMHAAQTAFSTHRICRWGAGMMLFLAVGCGGGSSPPEPANPTPSASSPPPSHSQNSVSQSPEAPPAGQSSSSQVDPERKETKWIGKIPYDVFFDQPLVIATDSTTIGTSSTAATASTESPTSAAPSATMAGMPAPAADNAPASTPAATGTGNTVDWDEILPLPMLVEEVKLIRTRLTGNLQTVATFNRAQKPIAQDGGILAGLAALAPNYDEPLAWKDNARFVRDLAVEINENSAGTGREPYTKTKDPFDKLTVILDGGKPPEMDAPEQKPFSEVIYVSDMMKRIEQSFNLLKSNINTQDRLKENPADVERELRILMTLGTLMMDSSYDYADQPAYQNFLKSFTDGTRAGVMAVHSGSLESFQSALNQVQTTCAGCHQEFRGSGTGF